MTSRARVRLAARAVLLALACAPPLGALAQVPKPAPAPAPAPPTAPAAPAEPTPIALPSLVAEAETAERFARSIGSEIEPSREQGEIDQGLADLAPSLSEGVARIDVLLDSRGASLDAILAETRDWRARGDQLARWQASATDRLIALERGITEIETRAEIWSATRDAARATDAPSESLSRIDAVRAALRAALRDARDARRGLVDLQGRIAEQQSTVGSALERLDAARKRAEISLLESDSPPLWRALGESKGAWQRAAEQLESDARLTSQYLARARGRLVAQALAFAFVAWLCFLGRGFAARVRDDAQLAASAAVFARPFASSLLVSLALTLLFHPNAPAGAYALTRVALIVPLLRLLPALAPRELTPVIVAAGLLALVGEVRAALTTSPALARALFAVELASAAATLVWMMRPARLALLPAGGQRIPRALHIALRAALFALLAAFAANLFGWSNLAYLLGGGTIRALYAALVIYAGARVLLASLRAALLSERASQRRLLRDHAGAVQATGSRIVTAASFALWAVLAINGFGMWQAAAAAARAVWHFELAYGEFAVSIGDLAAFGLTIWAAATLARFTRFVLEGDVLSRFSAQRGAAHALARTAQYVVLLVGFFVATSAAGIDMSKFSILAGAFGVGIGFGLQNIVNNFVSGLILLYERPIQIGDTIDVAGVSGDVAHIGVRSSTLRTAEGARVIVPNATLIAERVTNWTFTDRTRRADLRVRVAYGSDPHKVIELLLGCAREHRDALAHPDPLALLVAFGSDALEFELRFWTHLDLVLTAKSEIALAVNDALARAGIAIPLPQRDLHLRSVSPEAARAIGEPREPS